MSSTNSEQSRVVVIGAGVGGLASAIRLAAAGLKVMILEKQGYPGGKMRTVASAAGPVDAGPTVLTLRQEFEDLFAAAGVRLSDYVTLIQQTLLARHFWPDGTVLDLHADENRSAKEIAATFGAAAAREFRAFNAETRRLFDSFEAPVMQAATPTFPRLAAHVARNPALIPAMAPMSTMAKKLTRRFSDRRLAQLFGRYATYVGGSPYQSPALLCLIWQAEHAGVWCVKGGMHRLAEAMAQLATQLGCEFRYDAPVAQIHTGSGRITGVTLETNETVQADQVVFNGDPRALATGLLGPTASQVAKNTLQDSRSYSARVWSFAATPSGVDLAHHNVFFADDPESEFRDLADGRMPHAPSIYVCAQDRGAGQTPPQLERFEIILNAPPLSQAAQITEEVETCQALTFQTLARMGLQFDPLPEVTSLATPATYEALFPGSDGSLYGQSPHGMLATFRRPTARTEIKGLYLAGGGTHPGAGIPMATRSGRHAAEAIMADLALTSTSRPTAMRGGMSTGSATITAAPSRLSGS